MRLQHLLIPVDPLLRFALLSVTQVIEPESPSQDRLESVRWRPSGSRSDTRLQRRSSADSRSSSRRSRRCEWNDEDGSMVLGLGVLVLVLVLAVGIGAVGAGVAGYVHAAGAADAAALAAAPVTFRPFGARGSPAQEAARFASANRTRLVRCTCPIDRSWDTRTVTVVVERRVDLPGLGSVDVRATSRATFEPSALLQP